MMARLQAWGAAAMAALVAVLVAFGWGRLKGARRARDDAADRIASSERQAAIAERERDDSELRSKVETNVLQRPSGITAPVADAVPDSAADRLQHDWSRD